MTTVPYYVIFIYFPSYIFISGLTSYAKNIFISLHKFSLTVTSIGVYKDNS